MRSRRERGVVALAVFVLLFSSLQVVPVSNVDAESSASSDAIAVSSESSAQSAMSDGFGEGDLEASIIAPDDTGQWQRPISISVLPDRLIYTYDSVPQRSALPSVGDYLSGFDDSGTIRIVSAVESDANVVTVYASQSGLTGEQTQGLSAPMDSGLYLGANIDLMVIDETIHYEESVDNEFGDALLEADGRFYLKMSACFLADIGWTGLTSAAIVLYVDFEASVNFKVTGTIEWERELAGFEYNAGVFWIGWIPVTVTLYWSLEATFNAEGSLSIGANANAFKAMGIIYSGGQWSNYETGDELSITPTTPEAGVDAEARLSMPFGIRTLVFGLVGPYVGLEPYARAMLSASLTGLDYGLFIGVDVIAGFRCECWGMVIADYSMTLMSWEYKVWPSEESQAPSAPSIVGNLIDYSHASPWITLTFQHSSRDLTSSLASYEITRIPWMTPVSLSISGSSARSWTDAVTSYGATYIYSVVVVAKDGGRSPPADVTVAVPSLAIAVQDPPGVTPSYASIESGMTISLSWTMPIAGSGDSVDVYLASVSGPLHQLADSVSNSGTYGSFLWSVSQTYPISSPYMIKVVSESRPEVFGYSSTPFTIVTTPRTITVTQPNPGSVVLDDEVLHIRWQTTGSVTYVRLRLESESQQWWVEFQLHYENTGIYDYDLNHFFNTWHQSQMTQYGKILVNGSSDFKVVVIDYSNPSVFGESGLFSLLECPLPVQMTSPTGMDVLFIDQMATITWNSYTPSSTIEIYVYYGGSYWEIGHEVPNTGSFSFSVDINNYFTVPQGEGQYHYFFVGVRDEGVLWACISSPILVWSFGDDFEYDDDYLSAKQIVPDYPQHHNLKNYKPDQDWTWFDVDEVSNVTLETFSLGSVTDTQMWLFGEQSAPGVAMLYNDDSTISNKSAMIRADYLAPGKYYVKTCPGFVGPFDEPYAISLRVESCGISRLLVLHPSLDDVLRMGQQYELQWLSSDAPNGSVRLSLQTYQGYAPTLWSRFDTQFGLAVGAAPYGDLLYLSAWMPNPSDQSLFVVRQSDLSIVASKNFPWGSGVNQLGNPMGIAVDENYVYICDSMCRVVKLTKDLSWVGSVGSAGPGVGQFVLPYDIEVVGDMLYVADMGNGRIVVLDKTDLSWVTDTGMNSYVGAYGIASCGDYLYVCGSGGTIYVLDRLTVTPLFSKTIPYSPLWGITVDSRGMFVTADLVIVQVDPETLDVIDTYNGAGLYGAGYENHFYGLAGLAMTSEWLYSLDWDTGIVGKIGRPHYDEVLVIADSTENDLSHSWKPPQSLAEGRYTILAELLSDANVTSRSGEFDLVRVPGVLANVVADSSPGCVNITWQTNTSEIATVTYHAVYRNTSMGGWEQVAKGLTSMLWFSDTTVRPGTMYIYRVAAGNDYGDGDYVELIGYTVPGIVTGLMIVCDSVTLTVTLAWEQANVGDMASTYLVYRSVNGGPFELYNTTDQPVFIDANVTSGQSYRYQVMAVNDVGNGEVSDFVEIVPVLIPEWGTVMVPVVMVLLLAIVVMRRGGKPSRRT